MTKNPAVYCGSGVSACINLLSLSVAGIDNGRLYAGSWSLPRKPPRASRNIAANSATTKAINSLVMQLTKLITYTGFGAMTFEIGSYSLVIGIGGAIGAWFASKHLKNINPTRFRIYTLILMPICGAMLLIKAFG